MLVAQVVSLQPDVLISQGGDNSGSCQHGWAGEERALCVAGTWCLNGHFIHFSAARQSPDSNLSYALGVAVLSECVSVCKRSSCN